VRWSALRGVGCHLAIFALGLGAACGRADRPARAPNFVVVLVDDLRWDDIGIAGHPFVETPSIDQLAREGTRFLNAFATTPLCSPSRASILTGQYAWVNGIVDNTARDSASHRLSTFAIPLAEAGYRTAFIGKWHMGNDDTAPGMDALGCHEGAGRGRQPAPQRGWRAARAARVRDRRAH
jgi:arylsulfatase A-like enzyme